MPTGKFWVNNHAHIVRGNHWADRVARRIQPGRLRIMAEELENELAKHMLVDWADRDSLRARMRNTARIILRKFSYPSMIRDEAVSRIIGSLAKNQKDRHTR